ncbi:hypothetical protein EQH57_0093 [Dictyocoela roeselum]|nr:hypothetical protein EQH57_0093 [Dictyocoela roeselum]
MTTIKIFKSQKNHKKIVFEGYIYNFDRKCLRNLSWRCYKKGCTGRILTDFEIKIVLKKYDHWHEIEEEKICRILMNNKLENIISNENIGFDSALNKVITEEPAIKINDINNLNNIRDYYTRRLRRKKENEYNNNEKILEIYKYTFSNEKFLQNVDSDPENGYLFFCSETAKNILNKAKILMADGTFYTSPQGYSQVYIIYTIYFGKSVPQAYILMKSKSAICYDKIFAFLKNLTNTNPEYFIIDYEITSHNIIRKYWINVKLRGCVFHFSQIITRFLLQNNLLPLYRTDSSFKNFVKYLIFLAYVPEEFVKSEFDKICELSNKNNEFEKISIFFRDNFINNSKNSKNKCISFWSANERILKDIPTTTNTCEAYHRHLNSKVSRKNQKLGKIIDILKKEEQRIKIIMSN